MKKIFRMALVFALAGATLMYTSCTKDYQEEINKLDGQISNLESSLNGKLADLQTELSNVKSSVSSLETAYKAADKALEGDIAGLVTDVTGLKTDVSGLKTKVSGFETELAGLKTKVGAIENAIKDLDKLATKEEVSAAKAELEQKIADDLAAVKAEILEKVDDLSQSLADLEADLRAELALKADAEEVEIRLKAIEEAQASIDEVYGFLSDELRSIVFLPDFYFAGIEATSYDFGSFLGFEILRAGRYGYAVEIEDEEAEEGEEGEEAGTVLYTFDPGAAMSADLLYDKKDGKPVYYKTDPETGAFLRDKDGNLIVSTKNSETNKALYYPGNHLQGQVGKAMYNLNPSSFPVDSAEWSLEGRDVKYVLKSDEETWAPVFEGISKDENGLATVLYSIENPELIFSSMLGAIDDLFGKTLDGRKGGYDFNWYEFEQKAGLAEKYDYNNIPTMHLVGKLSGDRSIFSDWHAISSNEELVSHLAFRNDNPYVAYDDCGKGKGKNKDLFYSAESTLYDDPSVPVKYNGGSVDLAELIAIHTMNILYIDQQTMFPTTVYENYTLAEFVDKYPGYHFEFEMVPYTIGNELTSEDMYGKLDGTMFTPCYVKPTAEGVESIPIAKDDTSVEGISSVGRMPMILVTLVNDETGIAQTAGWFRIVIAKDPKEPEFFELPDQPKVPFICGDFTIFTKWFDFSYFVLEKLKIDYKSFLATYKYDGVWANFNGLKGSKLVSKFENIDNNGTGTLQFENYKYVDGEIKKVDEDWGKAVYSKDYTGSGVNDAFEWTVSPQGLGEGSSRTIYYRFSNGENIVYFAMNADVAQRPKMYFASNKKANEWWDDINKEPKNTVRMNVPVPSASLTDPVVGGDVMKFQREIGHWFNGYKPQLGLVAEESDPLYANFFNKTTLAMYGLPDDEYKDEELLTDTEFFFSQTQPVIKKDGKSYPLYTNWWGEETVGNDTYPAGKLLYTGKFNAWGRLVEKTVVVDDEDVKVPAIDENYVIAAILPLNGPSEEVSAEDPEADPSETVENPEIVKYLATDMSKKLLNFWSYTKTDQAEMLYANILTKNTYGECGITLDDGLFYIRFIRPLDVQFTAQEPAGESYVDGYNVELAKFISGITDWNKQLVLKKEMGKDGKTWTGYYVPNYISTVNMYEYYGFSKLTIDFTKTQIDHWNIDNPAAWDLLSKIAPKAKLSVGKLVEVTVADGSKQKKFEADPNVDLSKPYELDITDFSALKGIMINYKNDEAYVSDFSLRIPVAITYSWGTMEEYFVINIKETTEVPKK